MKINYNASAAIANKHLLGIENNLGKSVERLSSGLKINHSKDNPAGMAISNKMRVQIDGLNRASKNSSNGISITRIADGALNETSDILARMRELSVQAASDATMSLEDKQAIQLEIESLKKEVDRISTDTEYNSKPLLDGTLDTRVYTDHCTRIAISDYVPAGDYSVKVTDAATQAQVQTNGVDFTSTTSMVGVSGEIRINGYIVNIDAADTLDQAYEKIRSGGEVGETTVIRDNDGNLSFTADAYGKQSVEKITFESEALARALGFGADGQGNDVIRVGDVFGYGQYAGDGVTVLYPVGEDMKLSEDRADWVGFSDTATAYFEGNKVTITDIGGFSLSFLVDAHFADGMPELDYKGDEVGGGAIYDGLLNFEVTNMGTMTLQIGANMDQNMEVRIPEVSARSLYIDDLDVTTVNGADNAIVALDKAVTMVNEVRSRIGAYENRLEHTEKSLDAFEENMTNALSGLTDTDMAEEMTNYTQQNVLNQAAISVLTQANDIPQQILSILQ